MQKSLPINLTIVATLFLVGGISTIIDFLSKILIQGALMLPFGGVGVFIAIGLLSLEEIWRRVAVGLLVLLIFVTLIGLFFGSLASVFGTPRMVGSAADIEAWRLWIVGGIGVITYVAGAIYSLITLTEPEIKKLFRNKKHENA